MSSDLAKKGFEFFFPSSVRVCSSSVVNTFLEMSRNERGDDDDGQTDGQTDGAVENPSAAAAAGVRSFVHSSHDDAVYSLLSHLGGPPFCVVVVVAAAPFIVLPDRVEGAVFADSRAENSFWTLKRFLPHVFGDRPNDRRRKERRKEGTNGRNFGEWQRERAPSSVAGIF